jgi:hypothetical protein
MYLVRLVAVNSEKMFKYLYKIEWDDVHWIIVSQVKDQLTVPCEHSNKIQGSIKCAEFVD